MYIVATSTNSPRTSERVQVLVDAATKRSFEDMARREGLSLSAWLREAGLERAAKQPGGHRFRDVRELDAFFAECAAREAGREPDWQEHEAAIAGSVSRGGSDT